MSIASRNPVRMAGASMLSGELNTGELRTVRGGGRTFTNFSGTAAGNDVLIQSGAGRLNSIMQHVQMVSGQTVFLYDSAIATSGGPFAASGHKIVGIVPPTWPGGSYSGTGLNVFTGIPTNVDMPFQSGLVAATRSGTPGFTISFSLEANPTNPNNF